MRNKVYFDARMIDHPGIGRYIRCLLSHMLKNDSIDMYLLGDRNKIKKFLGVEKNIIDFDYPIYSLQEQMGFIRLKGIIGGYRGKKGDCILHIPHYNIPVLTKFHLVVTVHDLIHIVYPAGASGRLAPLYMRFMINKIVKTANGIICVSEATKRALENYRGKKGDDRGKIGDRIRVIYEGVDKVFGRIDDQDLLRQVRKKYNLPDKFLLYVGSVRRHKNIGTLLDAFDSFKKKIPEARLVMVGRTSQDIDIKRDGVIYLGELKSDKELAAIYNLASCLFNLSLYEGFGLTILEAQKCGLPVVCSDIAVHREIGGNGITAVNPSYIDQICEDMYNILFNSNIRETSISKGLENAKRFDWSYTAKKTIELYRKIHDEGSNSSRLADRDAGRRKDPKCFLQNISSG